MALGRLDLVATWLALLLPACGTQVSDPIYSVAAQQSGGAPADGEPPCPSEWVARFDGASFATTPRSIQDDFTIEAWISTTSPAPGEAFGEGMALIFADVEKVTVNDFALALLNDQLVLSVGTVGTPDIATPAMTKITTGEWVHVAATRSKQSGVTMTFVNGVLEGSAAASTQTLGDEPSLRIGGRPGRNFFVGSMSDVRLWNVVRSQAEILAHMQHRLAGDEPGLVGYYRFDEQEGQLAHDASPEHHDAAIEGAIVWEKVGSPFCAP